MSKVKFKQVGTGLKTTTRRGNQALHLELDSELVKRIKKEDFSNLWLFYEKTNYLLCGLVGKDPELYSKEDIQEKLLEIRTEALLKLESYSKSGNPLAQQASSLVVACDELVSKFGIKFDSKRKSLFEL